MNEIISAVIGALGAIIASLVKWDSSKNNTKSVKRKQYNQRLILAAMAFVLATGSLAYLLLRPAPQAHILKPDDCNKSQTVPTTVNVIVEYKNIRRDHYLWTVVRIPGVRPIGFSGPARIVYPQLQTGKLPTPVIGTGNLEIEVQLGGKDDSRSPFNILVLLLDKKSNELFSAYSTTCIKTGTCGGIPLPDEGVEILDFVTVMRE